MGFGKKLSFVEKTVEEIVTGRLRLSRCRDHW